MSEPLPRHARELLNRFKQLQVLTLASIQVARNRVNELSKALEETGDDEVALVDFTSRRERLNQWLTRARELLVWLDRKSHEVGVVVEKVQMGAIEPQGEKIRRLSQLMFDKHQQVAVRALEHLGRGNYNEALELGQELLVDQSNNEDVEELETTDEFESLMEDVNDGVDDILEAEAEESPSTTRMDDPTTNHTQ